MTGFYWLDEEKFGALGLVRANQTNPTGPTPILDPAFPPRSFIFFTDGTTEAYAAFAQVDVKLTDTWTATAGVRYSDEEKNDFSRFSLLNPDTELLGVFSPRPIPAATAANIKRQTKKDSALTPKLALQWQPNEDALYYASFTKGFKSGGFNDPADAGQQPAVQPGVSSRATSSVRRRSGSTTGCASTQRPSTTTTRTCRSRPS